MLDPEILREPAVKFYLNQALDMMNRAVAGTFQPGARENMAYFVSTEKRLEPHVPSTCYGGVKNSYGVNWNIT